VSETQLSADIRQALGKLGVWVLRIQSGKIPAYYNGRVRYIHCAEPGTPDLFCPALNLWLEVKTPAGRLSKEQRAWHAKAKRLGVVVVVVRSVRAAVEVARAQRSLAFIRRLTA